MKQYNLYFFGEAALSFEHNKQFNAVTDNVVVTIVQRMNESLDRLEDILKSCQMSRMIDPVETNQHLPAQSDIIFNKCGMNGHEPSECSPSHNISTCGACKPLNSFSRENIRQFLHS